MKLAMHFVGLIAACLLPASIDAAEEAPSKATSEQFRQWVAPALAAKCVACHRPDNLKGGNLRETLVIDSDGGREDVVVFIEEMKPVLDLRHFEATAKHAAHK